jgi:hypothetical protein
VPLEASCLLDNAAEQSEHYFDNGEKCLCVSFHQRMESNFSNNLALKLHHVQSLLASSIQTTLEL